MVSNKDISWIHNQIQGRYEDAKGVEKSILGEVLGLFDAAPEFQIVMTLNDATDEELRHLLQGMRHECVILPGGTEASIELVQNDWIPVTEGLPTVWQIASDDEHAGEPLEFIVFIDGAEIPTTLYFNGTWFIDNFGEPYPVTHWMPMPEPPKED